MNRLSNTVDDRGVVILVALGKLGKHVYGGTVAHAEKQHRRTANRVARRSRRINRATR